MTEQTIHNQARDDVLQKRKGTPKAKLQECGHLDPLAQQYLDALRRGERHVASLIVLQAVETGTSVKDIYMNVFQPVLYEIGLLWQINRLSVAEEHYCTAATQLIMSQLYPYIFDTPRTGRTLVATSVAGNLHEVGIRMVADFFEMDGWNTYYLGANTPNADVISTIIGRKAELLAVSAALSCHIEPARELIEAVRDNAETSKITILVGGPPFNRDLDLWKEIGADGAACDAQEAIAMANQIVKERLSSIA